MQEALVHSWVRKICWRKDTLPTAICFGFLCGLAGKESACSVGDLDSIPGLGRYPGEGNAYPSQQPKEAPRGGKPAPSRQVHLFFPYCCHATLSVKPQAQPRHTESTREKHNVSQGASSPAQPTPHPRSSGMIGPCPCPPWLEIQLCPAQMPPPARLADISAARGGPMGCGASTVQAKSSFQTLVSVPWLLFLSTRCGCQSCPLTPTSWPQAEQSLLIRRRGHTAGMDGRGRGGWRNWAW